MFLKICVGKYVTFEEPLHNHITEYYFFTIQFKTYPTTFARYGNEERLKDKYPENLQNLM